MRLIWRRIKFWPLYRHFPKNFVLGIRIQGRRLEGADGSTELWPESNECYSSKFEIESSLERMKIKRFLNIEFRLQSVIFPHAMLPNCDVAKWQKSFKFEKGKLFNGQIQPFSFFKWAKSGLFFIYFCSFQTNNTIFTSNQCEKMSIQYLATGFEPTTFRTWFITHNH